MVLRARKKVCELFRETIFAPGFAHSILKLKLCLSSYVLLLFILRYFLFINLNRRECMYETKSVVREAHLLDFNYSTASNIKLSFNRQVSTESTLKLRQEDLV